MQLTKPAQVQVLGHNVAQITDTSQPLPGVGDAVAAGARGVMLQNLDVAGDPLWLALNGSDAAVDYAIRFEPRGTWIWYLTDLAAIRVIATPGNSAKIGVTWLR